MSSPVSEKSIDRMIRLTLTGNYQSACELLIKCGIPHSLFEKIQEILNNPIGVSTQEKHTDMKGKIVAVLNSPVTVPLELAVVEKPLSDPTHFCMAPPEADFFSDVFVPSEIIRIIFLNSWKIGADRTMHCLNRRWYECQTPYQDLIKTGALTIIDAAKMGFKVDDEPSIDEVRVVFHCDRLASSVMDNAGFSLVTIPSGQSIESYEKIAEQTKFVFEGLGFLGKSWNEEPYNDVAKHSSRVLMPNHVFKQTVPFSTLDEIESCINGFDCELPQPRDCFFQLVSTKLIFDRCAYMDFKMCSSCVVSVNGNKSVHVISVKKGDERCLSVELHPCDGPSSNLGAGGVIRFEGKPDKK